MTGYVTVDVATPSASNAIRSHDHPVLESGNLSFPKGRYSVGFRARPDGRSYEIYHNIEKVPLIETLVRQGRAKFACVVSSPLSAHRSIHVSSCERQLVECDNNELGEPPFFTAMVVSAEDIDIVIDSERDGVHSIWSGQNVKFYRGARLALGSVVQLQSSILHLLSLHEDDTLGDGQFVVDTASEPFRFRVKVGTKLHKGLRYPNNMLRDHIMTHIVTACLAHLKSEYSNDDGDEGWRSIPNLRSFAEHLEQNGHGHWCNSEFYPEKVSTALYPHLLPSDNTVD